VSIRTDRPARDTVAIVASGWVALALVMVFRDVHDLFRPGLIDGMRRGVVDGTRITEELMLVGGVGVLFVVDMPLVVRLLPRRPARVVLLSTTPVVAATVVLTGVRDADDVLFLVVELGLLAWLGWVTWRWPVDERQRT